MGMKQKGLIKALYRFDKLKEELGDAAGQTAQESAENLYEKSQFFVPKKTGKLAESGRFVIHKNTGSRRIWGVKYGKQVKDSSDESVLDYAAAVHEILKASHAPPTKAKYVEDPLIQSVKLYKAIANTEARQAVKRAFR